MRKLININDLHTNRGFADLEGVDVTTMRSRVKSKRSKVHTVEISGTTLIHTPSGEGGEINPKHIYTRLEYSLIKEVSRTEIDRRIKSGKIETIKINGGLPLIYDEKEYR
jgi:hypothetical protein